MYIHSNKEIVVGIDVGGSHITAALLDAGSGQIVDETISRSRIDNNGASHVILNLWSDTIRAALSKMPDAKLKGIGFAIPGPFNYQEGICLMKGVNKYESLYGINISEYIKREFSLANDFPLKFENDACCFGLGESFSSELLPFKNIIAITLGTGFGATFIQNTHIKKSGEGVPPSGTLYNFPYLDGIAEDYVSATWLLKAYNCKTGQDVKEVAQIADKAICQQDENAQVVFNEFGQHLAACLIPWIKSFRAECLVIGGNISKSSSLFLSPLRSALKKEGIQLVIKTSTLMELSAVTGAASLIQQTGESITKSKNKLWRKTTQALLPDNTIGLTTEAASYNIYPYYNIGNGNIFSGYDSLAAWIATQRFVMIDGYGGNDWKIIQAKLGDYFNVKHIRVCWFEMQAFQRPVDEINRIVSPFLGESDSVWGTRSNLSMADFYDIAALRSMKQDDGYDVTVIIGTGAALANWESLIYVDLPKNEIQYRMRAGSITNIGNDLLEPPAVMYKRFYFVDWVVLNNHRREISNRISVIADGQWKDTINWSFATAIQQGLRSMSVDVIRARPWFEAGAWGGQWMKNNIAQINKSEINYAWSFELIAPENGLVLESDHNLLEVSFDWLMEQQPNEVLGQDAERFGSEFPIRFDFLDTFNGGNLSIQCHPSLKYIQEQFGENITQDETYYILDCTDEAQVYLGFQDNIDPEKFRNELQRSADNNTPMNITDYVQVHGTKKHDLFLIPNQTIHSAGKNNLVLEISATPYIFTFKMYDWLRLDLEGNPRPINIHHAFNNLDFSRKGDVVGKELVSKQHIIEETNDYRIVHLPTHAEHFYDVHRIELAKFIEMDTNNKCFVMMVVEGRSVLVRTEGNKPVRFNYAETFIIPAGVKRFSMTNETEEEVKIIKAFIK